MPNTQDPTPALPGLPSLGSPLPLSLPLLPLLAPPLPAPACPRRHFRPWHRGSLFGDGPRRPLSADERRAWLARAEAECNAGRLTPAQALVARALLRRLGADGRCDPSHATLAADSGRGERTVRRALDTLRGLGLLTWQQRLLRRPWPAGGAGASRAEQTSNAYELQLPGHSLAPREARERRAARPARAAGEGAVELLDCGGQTGRETLSQYTQGELLGDLPVPSAAELERIRALVAARQAQRVAEWQRERMERCHGRG